MKCETCQGLGYREYEHGLIRLRCPECKGTGEVGALLEENVADEVVKIIELQETNGNNIRTEPANSDTRGGDTSKSASAAKPKAKRKRRKKTR